MGDQQRMRISSGQRGHKRWDKMNHPPPGKSWVWITCEMMESPAWRALTAPAKRVVERILIEHMHHGGTMNGELVVTYDDFQSYGISRKSIRPTIEIAKNLGFIDVTFKGVRSHGLARRPSKYALTWFPRNDGTSPSNRWCSIKTRENAFVIVAGVNEKRKVRTFSRYIGPLDTMKP